MRGSIDKIERDGRFDIVSAVFDTGKTYEFRFEHGKYHEGDRVVYDDEVLSIDENETKAEKARLSALQESVLKRPAYR